jgi:hypothetical protein
VKLDSRVLRASIGGDHGADSLRSRRREIPFRACFESAQRIARNGGQAKDVDHAFQRAEHRNERAIECGHLYNTNRTRIALIDVARFMCGRKRRLNNPTPCRSDGFRTLCSGTERRPETSATVRCLENTFRGAPTKLIFLAARCSESRLYSSLTSLNNGFAARTKRGHPLSVPRGSPIFIRTGGPPGRRG